MRIMGIPGFTPYHLKSHLQKYRLAKHQESNMFHQNKQQDSKSTNHWNLESITTHQENEAQPQCETMSKMQMEEVQRKLEEQFEVQRHLQLRIEAQGKYLQSVLKKAQETLAGYSMNTIAVEAAKAELSELVSAVETECLSSSVSQDSIVTQAQHGDCSSESCLTSGDVLDTKQGNSFEQEGSSSAFNWSGHSDEFSSKSMKRMQSDVSNELGRVKRRCCRVRGEHIDEQHKIGGKIYQQQQEYDNSYSIQEKLDLNK